MGAALCTCSAPAHLNSQIVDASRLDRSRWRTTGRSNSFSFTPGAPSMYHGLATEKTPDDEALVAASLRGNPNLRKFAPFNEEEIRTLVSAAWKETLEEGEVLMHEGDLNNETFYIVASGSIEITSNTTFDIVEAQGCAYLSRPPPDKIEDEDLDGGRMIKVQTFATMKGIPATLDVQKRVHVVRRGCSFGDSSMFYGAPRWATMTALEKSMVWVLSQSAFRTVQTQMQATARLRTKSREDAALIAESLAFNGNLQQMVKLRSEHIKRLVDLAWVKTSAKGEFLMHEGDMNADAFYIIGGGEWSFQGTEQFKIVSDENSKRGAAYFHRAAHFGDKLSAKFAPTSDTPTVLTASRGLCFGEVSMIYCAPRFASAMAMTDDCYMLAIDRGSFLAVQVQAAEDEINSRVNHLNRLDCFNHFGERDKQKFVGIMEKMSFKKGDHILKHGKTNTALYILEEGKVQHTQGSSPVVELDADSNTGVVHFFGSEALSMGETGGHETALVLSEYAIALVLEHSQFEKICDRLVESAPVTAFTRYSTTFSKAEPAKDAMTLDNLDRKGLLGVCSHGPIELCRHKHTGELYALKSLNKGLIVQKGLRKSVVKEKKLCMEIIHPNIIRMVATFNEPQTLYFLMEVALGGELSRAYEQKDFCGSSKHTRYYAACIILALDHLHQRKIIYRNLKPSNILLSQRGQPKLADLSISKLVVSSTFTTCGTPAYMAPEVVAGIGHNRAADWWSLGVLIFELMSGRSPFESVHPMEIYSKVMRGIARVTFPSECQGLVKDLINSLLMPKAVERLPMKQGGVQKLLDHAWFNDFPWDKLRSQKLEPPYVPWFQIPPQHWQHVKDDQFHVSDHCWASKTLAAADVHLGHFSPDKASLPRPLDYNRDESGDLDWDADWGLGA